MKWSLRIAQVAGIGIYVHWTFLILLVMLVAGHVSSGHNAVQIAEGIGFVLALFGCVVLHELGHALTAQRFGVATRDITLLPIGGVARLERIPEQPWQEFWVAIAGPAVNVFIALMLAAVLLFWGGLSQLAETHLIGGPLLAKLVVLNLWLVVFNLLPAFPMDGGRVLRALLSLRMPRVRATHIAAGVGQFMAMLFAILGLVGQQWLLLFIALFVYLGAQGEAQAVEMNSIFRNVLVKDAMTTRFQTLSPDDTLARAAEELLAGHQHDFPVIDGAQVVGILRRTDLIRALQQRGPETPVRDVMCTECGFVTAFERLDQALNLLHNQQTSTLPVFHNGRLVGLLTSENIGEWTMIHAALRDWHRADVNPSV